MSKSHPTPWKFFAEDECEDTPITDANGDEVLIRDSGYYPPDNDTCREIVDAVNERDKLRDIIRRLITVRENVFWRKDEKTGMNLECRMIDEDFARKAVSDAKAALG